MVTFTLLLTVVGYVEFLTLKLSLGHKVNGSRSNLYIALTGKEHNLNFL